MSSGLNIVLLMMFGGHGDLPEQDLRERPEQEVLEEKQAVPAPRQAQAAPLRPRLIGPFAGKICRGRA